MPWSRESRKKFGETETMKMVPRRDQSRGFESRLQALSRRKLGISAIWSLRDKGVAWSGGCHAPLPQKTLKKKVNLTELSQDAKKNFFDLFFIMLMV